MAKSFIITRKYNERAIILGGIIHSARNTDLWIYEGL